MEHEFVANKTCFNDRNNNNKNTNNIWNHHCNHNDDDDDDDNNNNNNNNNNNRLISRPRPLLSIATRFLSQEHTKESLVVSSINGTFADNGEYFHHAVDVEQSQKSPGLIDKDENCKTKINISTYQLSLKRNICNTKYLTPLIVQKANHYQTFRSASDYV